MQLALVQTLLEPTEIGNFSRGNCEFIATFPLKNHKSASFTLQKDKVEENEMHENQKFFIKNPHKMKILVFPVLKVVSYL